METNLQRATTFDIVWSIFSFGLYLFDIASDLLVTYYFYSGGQMTYSAISMTLVLVPASLVTLFSTILERVGDEEKKNAVPWHVYALLLVPQGAPVKRHLQAIRHAFNSKTSRYDTIANEKYKMMLEENANVALLKLYEGFTEAAPQAVLQTFVLIRVCFLEKEDPVEGSVGVRIGSIIFSWISLATTVTAFSVSNRRNEPENGTFSKTAAILYFLWQFLCLSSRITAVAVCIAICEIDAVPLISVHYAGMFVWLYFYQREHSGVFWRQMLSYLMYAAIHIFSRFNVKPGNTREFYVMFYSITFVEDVIILVLFSATAQTLAALMLAVGAEISFAVGISLMLVYYKHFHPHKLQLEGSTAVQVPEAEAPSEISDSEP